MAEDWIGDGLVAGSVAAVLSGVPSTLWALATGEDALEAAVPAGSILLPGEQRKSRLLSAAIPVHGAISLGWGLVLVRLLPRRNAIAAGALAGLAIAVLDLGIVGRRFPRVHALPRGPQVGDHVLYGAVVGAVLERRGRKS